MPVLSIPTCVTPAAASQSRKASRSRVTVRNVRTSFVGRSPDAPIRRHATTVSWCTSNPQHRSTITRIIASCHQKATATPQVLRDTATRAPVSGGDKEWYLYAARAGLLIGVANHRRGFQPRRDRPRQDWDKPARVATVFIDSGAPPALVGCLAHRFHEPILCAGLIFPDMACRLAALIRKRGFLVMAGLRRTIELAIGEEDLAELRAIARPRMEPSSGSPCESMVSRRRDFATI